MLGRDTAAVQADRLGATCELARMFNAIVVLKGCGSVIAAPDGRWFINGSCHGGMATGGTGDVLTGLVAALLAQHWPAEFATLAAVHLHGCAADQLADTGVGPIGLTASELPAAARQIFNRWVTAAG
jgi:NAD(P)H-hydrate repair Nnr-like enzyme with NAD(P)H-hydrate dehydratase domain